MDSCSLSVFAAHTHKKKSVSTSSRYMERVVGMPAVVDHITVCIYRKRHQTTLADCTA